MSAVLKSAASSKALAAGLIDLFLQYPADRIPESARHVAVNCIADTIGVALAAVALKMGLAGAKIALEAGSRNEAVVWGFGKAVQASDAALANGMLAHALDYDDTHPAAIMHASAVNVPTALALGEKLGANAEELLSALVLGYEVSARLGKLAPGAFQDRGFQSTAVLGIFAAVFIASRLYRVSPAVAANAFGIAGSMAAGLMEYLSDGTDPKQLHPGWMAHSGIMAVQLAMAGMTGPSTVLEGRFGVYRAFAHLDVDPTSALAWDGEKFEIESIAPKPYPACLCCHPLIQAALDLHRRKFLVSERIDDIAEICCEVPQWYVNLVFEPHERKRRARNAYEARFSAPFCIARATIDGALGAQSFSSQMLDDPLAEAIAGKVKYRVRDFPEFPDSFPGLIRVTFKSGESRESYVPHNLGSVNNPLGTHEIHEKFLDCASLALDKQLARRLLVVTVDLLHGGSCEDFWKTLRSINV